MVDGRYFGYELSKEIEPSLKTPDSPFKLPVAFASRVKTSIIYDHIDNEIIITSDDQKNFEKDLKEIEKDFSKVIFNEKNLKKNCFQRNR